MKRFALLLAVSISLNPLFALAQVSSSAVDAPTAAVEPAVATTTEIIVKYKGSGRMGVL